MADPVLELKGLNKSFGGVRATRDVHLSLQQNEVHALIGPNGAGKSTLIAQIFGDLKPDSGQVLLNGEDVTQLHPYQRARRRIARSFQISSVMPELTVLEHVMLGSYGTQLPKLGFWKDASTNALIRAKAFNALELVNLADRAGLKAGALPYGGRRHLELAMLLAAEPKVILLDEPMAGVGREESLELAEVVRDLTARCAILLVEHDVDIVLSLSDRITVLVDGAVVASGSPDEIRTDERVVQAYFGEAA